VAGYFLRGEWPVALSVRALDRLAVEQRYEPRGRHGRVGVQPLRPNALSSPMAPLAALPPRLDFGDSANSCN
jgi:hypothetical protein